MTIVVKDHMIGTFNWEVPRFVEEQIEKMASVGKELGWTSDDIDKAQQGVIRYFRDSIHPLLCLLSSSVLSGPLFGCQSEVIRDGIEWMISEIGVNLSESENSSDDDD